MIDVSAQDEIIRCLDNIQKNIDMRRKELICFDELIRARFVEMFGDPISNPYRYDKVSLSELADIKIGPLDRYFIKKIILKVDMHCLILHILLMEKYCLMIN